MELTICDGAAVVQGTIKDASDNATEHTGSVLFLSKPEVDALPETKKKALLHTKLDHLHALGTVQDGSYILVMWNAGYLFRKALRLQSTPFFALTQQPSSVMPRFKDLKRLLELSNCNEEILDHLAFALLQDSEYELATDAARQLCEKVPDSGKGWLRLGDTSMKIRMYKQAMLSYGRILHIANGSKACDYAVERISTCLEHTEWAHIFKEEEKNEISSPLAQYLFVPWSQTVRERFFEVYSGGKTPILQPLQRVGLSVPVDSSNFVHTSLFFRWLVPFQIALSSALRDKDDITMLSSPYIGIRHIISLTKKSTIDEAWLRDKSIKHTQVSIDNGHAPSIEQVDCIMEVLSDPANRPALIHCAAGFGGTSTIAACYLTAFGFKPPALVLETPSMQAGEAIAALRAMRPESIENSQQEAFVAKWTSVLWKRRSILPEAVSEPPPSSVDIIGNVPPNADLLVLVGLQGSGKSWFSRALRARNLEGWKRVNQDESGSRERCETDIGRDPQGKRVILDRCNPTSKDRAYWRGLAHWSSKPVLVWFDYPKDLCVSRAQRRLNHPTLIPGPQVRTAISSTAAQLESPTDPSVEGFVGIAIVRSFKAAQELVARFSPPIHLFKFPRTAHLLDLGAATEDDLHCEIFSRPSPSRPFDLDADSTLVITEKVDGANLGISLDEDGRIVIQNRAHWVNSKTHFQFKKLDLWVDEHREGLHQILAVDDTFWQRFILFGEWMVCVHSISYSSLPDRFLAFDLYDRTTGKFTSREVLEERLRGTGICLVPVIEMRKGTSDVPMVMPADDELRAMVQRPSSFYDGRVEGIYLKIEKAGWVVERGKVVRGDFISGNEHWTRGNLALNGIVGVRVPITSSCMDAKLATGPFRIKALL